MPLYLPLKYASFRGDTPLFFPATTCYAAHKFFRSGGKMPGWIERLTGSAAMLGFASSMSGTTSAEGMEEMTLSMITGEDAVFRTHAARLTDWIGRGERPDVIHLSSTLLSGIAKEIKLRLGIPVVCSVQDEEVWIDSLREPYAAEAWNGIRGGLKYIDGFVTASCFYRNVLLKRMPEIGEISVVYPGVNIGRYSSASCPARPVIGFFYRMNRENGLDILAEAFAVLKRRDSIKGLRLRIGGGYSGAAERRFVKGIARRLAPYGRDVVIDERYCLEEHPDFYASISVISVPIRFEECVGLYLCEAFAAGRPAVVPSTGSFPEIVGNAGIICEPNDSHSLADALEGVLSDADRYTLLTENAKRQASTRYSDTALAENLAGVYGKFIR
jgi:glycosyltransferase involved in cell wall biosynthesis